MEIVGNAKRNSIPTDHPDLLLLPAIIRQWPGRLREGARLTWAFLWKTAGFRPDSGLRIRKSAIMAYLDCSQQSVGRYLAALEKAELIQTRDLQQGTYLLALEDPREVSQRLGFRRVGADPQRELFDGPADASDAAPDLGPEAVGAGSGSRSGAGCGSRSGAPHSLAVRYADGPNTGERGASDVDEDKKACADLTPPSGNKNQESTRVPLTKYQTQESNPKTIGDGPRPIGDTLKTLTGDTMRLTAESARLSWKDKIMRAVGGDPSCTWIAEDLSAEIVNRDDPLDGELVDRILDQITERKHNPHAEKPIDNPGAYLNWMVGKLMKRERRPWGRTDSDKPKPR